MACDRNDGGEGAFDERTAVLVSDMVDERLYVASLSSEYSRSYAEVIVIARRRLYCDCSMLANQTLKKIS